MYHQQKTQLTFSPSEVMSLQSFRLHRLKMANSNEASSLTRSLQLPVGAVMVVGGGGGWKEGL